ncbi:MAG: aryl-sulfate sulfotransferase, partial [Candidatus Heimdallarchaeota archaeon]|nr:aryl-sulfate sulfotransferase [Candidatus Heimdallarchaeota archaeon]
LWNIETDVEEQLHFKGHHEYEWNPIDDTYFTLNQYLVFHDGLDYVYDRIAEFTPDGEMIWSVNMSDFVPFELWCPFLDTEYEGMADITHANSIFFDDVENVIYVNCRNTNTFYKIDHETGELLWSLGEYGDFELYNIDGNLKESLFYHGHALEKIKDDTFIYFDNDQHNQEDAQNRESRIIEIQVDEFSMEARIAWQWVSTDEYHSAWWGDADLLPNGNRLGTFGTLDHSGSTSIGARLVEVSNEGEIVWEMKYPIAGDIAHGVYTMERIDFAPIIEINETYWIKSGEEAIVNWEAFYNFRNKYEQSGSYSIFLEGIEIETNSMNFEKYWQPTEKSTNLGLLENGNYNLTFSIEDEMSHQNVQFVNLTVSKYPPDVTKTEGFTFVIVSLQIIIMTVLVIRKRIRRKKG